MKKMTNTNQSLVDTSLAIWPMWNDLGYQTRVDLLQRWGNALDSQLDAMVQFQCYNALDHVSGKRLMPGPTGETNELYCTGRGLFVITAQLDAPVHAVVGQLAAALVTGNTVFLCLPPSYPYQAKQLLKQFEQNGCMQGVITVIDYNMLDEFVDHSAISGVVYCGNLASAQQLSRQLAARDGLLAQLIAETDMEQLPSIASPTYCLRFVTERTRTINITAVGGNATLLELGNGKEN